MFKVIVEPDVCENNGLCEGIAPELFRLSDNDEEPVQVLQDTVDEELRDKAEQAVRSCPKQAIRLGEVR
jgi:ferredoxin